MMASVNKLDAGGRQGYRIRFYCDKRQREIYLPGLGKRFERMAEAVAGHVDAIAKAKAAGVPADPVAIAWANGTDGGLRENLVAWGLADPMSPRLATDEGRLLGPFVDAYLTSRTDWRPRTIANAKQVNRLLKEYFGERHPLKAITAADAERWRRWLASDKGLAVATCSKHAKRAKAMFGDAVRDRLLDASPFAILKGGDESNANRHRFIDAEMSARVLDACPDADWRLIFSLARWGGLRCPSEVLGLQWCDVDWAAGRLRIQSVKTGLRFCPIFPEIRRALDEAFAAAPAGAVYCVGRYRGAENLRTQFARIVERAGVVPWPKAFVNLRSTRRTELQEQFPDHAVNRWLGHSGDVAARHYLQVTDEHWARAVDAGSLIASGGAGKPGGKLDSRPLTGPLITHNQGLSGSITETKKPRENPGFDGLGRLVIDARIPPQGLEPWTQGLRVPCSTN